MSTASASVAGPLTTDLHAPGGILLVACYELGKQPLSLAWPLAALQQAGFQPSAVDASLDDVPDDAVRRAGLLVVATPMHTALRLALPILRHAALINPQLHRCTVGLYAGLHREHLLAAGLVESALSGEVEDELVALATRLSEAGEATAGSEPVLTRLALPVPVRTDLPALDRYAHLVAGDDLRQVASVETTRGCRHTCRHCPITPVYQGRFFAVPFATVMADIDQQVRAGATHVSFGDPDFLNGPGHARRVVRALHAAHPHVTFDATIKVEHLLRHRDLLAEFRAAGCLFIVSAVESLSDEVLLRLRKGHSRQDVLDALAALDAVGIALRPSLLPFTPWSTAADYLDLLDWIDAEDLVENVDPVHLAIRLLVPPGSALLDSPETAAAFGPYDVDLLSHTWQHPDPRLDVLQGDVAALVATASRHRWPNRRTFARIRALAAPLVVGRASAARPTAARRPVAPRLTESWFC